MVSIIIPIFNAKDYLEKCIISALKQTYSDIEVILVDDGSNDGSEYICDQIAQADNRVKVVHKNRGRNGVSAARNTGLNMATGEYVVFFGRR